MGRYSSAEADQRHPEWSTTTTHLFGDDSAPGAGFTRTVTHRVQQRFQWYHHLGPHGVCYLVCEIWRDRISRIAAGRPRDNSMSNSPTKPPVFLSAFQSSPS